MRFLFQLILYVALIGLVFRLVRTLALPRRRRKEVPGDTGSARDSRDRRRIEDADFTEINEP